MKDGIVDEGEKVGKVDGYSLGVTLGVAETIFVGSLDGFDVANAVGLFVG